MNHSYSGAWIRPGVFSTVALLLCGCSAFNPAFINLFESADAPSLATLPNAPGHVVIAFVNRTVLDEELLQYLAPRLQLTEAQQSALRPRLRMRVRVTYVDGSFRTIEFVDGSRDLIDRGFDSQAFPDLNQNDLNNTVVLCDVASVQIEPGSNIEVFIPVELKEFELVETTGPGGQTVNDFEQRAVVPPQFRPLRVDEVDTDGNVTLQRNIGVRDVPSPAPNVICGSVVAIFVDGVLAVPFLEGESSDPSLDRADAPTVAGIGGRYEITVAVQ